jgi:hypothetical protein
MPGMHDTFQHALSSFFTDSLHKPNTEQGAAHSFTDDWIRAELAVSIKIPYLMYPSPPVNVVMMYAVTSIAPFVFKYASFTFHF